MLRLCASPARIDPLEAAPRTLGLFDSKRGRSGLSHAEPLAYVLLGMMA